VPSLHALILFAVFHLAPTTPPDRAEEIYDTVAAATQDPDEALLLVVTLRYESQFRREVEDCRVVGDHGLALGGPQLHPHFRGGFSRRDYCGTPSLQAQLAVRALRMCRGGGTVRRAIARYMGRRERDPEVNRRVAAYEDLWHLAEQKVMPNGI